MVNEFSCCITIVNSKTNLNPILFNVLMSMHEPVIETLTTAGVMLYLKSTQVLCIGTL